MASKNLIKVRIDKLLNGDYATKAYASANIAGAFAVHGIKVIENDKGRFVAMPQESFKKNGETKYTDVFHAVTKEARLAMIEAVETAYEQALSQKMDQEKGMEGLENLEEEMGGQEEPEEPEQAQGMTMGM